MINVKRNAIVDAICITIILLIGSLVTYFAMNLFWSDIANGAQAFNFPYCFATLPLLSISLIMIAFCIFFSRYVSSPNEERMYLVKHYAKIFLAFSIVGLISTIICCTPLVYGSFLTPCPFPGSLIVYFIIFILLLGVNILLFVKVKKAITENDKKRKLTVSYCLYTVVIALFTFVAFDRCGAALISPSYIEWNRLDLTWSFYFSLLMPMIVLIVMILFKLGHLDLKNYKLRIIIWSILFIVGLSLAISTMITGINNSLMVSLISPAMPIERLATIPIDFIALYVPIVFISLGKLIISIVLLFKERKKKIN